MLKKVNVKKPFIKIYMKTIVSFFIIFILLATLSCINILYKLNIENLTMEKLITEKSAKANEHLSSLVYKTQVLSTLIINNEGKIEDFEKIASMIVDNDSIANVLVAPDGVVTNVYPIEGNESIIGFDFFNEGAGNKEAILAKEIETLVFGGPFTSVQGYDVLVARLPVFIYDDFGTKTFWGLVSITLKYPQVLIESGLNELILQGYKYEIWRINPDTNEKQIITSTHGYGYEKNMHYIERHINIQNSDWYLRISPVTMWYEYPDTWIFLFGSLSVSILIAFFIQKNNELKILKANYETLSQMDALTNIYNRRYFMSLAVSQVERVKRAECSAYIIMFDIDFFKKVNDTYGHAAGDDVLRCVTSRVREVIRPYDLFSRYGGEEFIILTTDIEKENAINLAERIRLNISERAIEYRENFLNITASFGIVNIDTEISIEKSIELADHALYTAKREGRNRVKFYENNKTMSVSDISDFHCTNL